MRFERQAKMLLALAQPRLGLLAVVDVAKGDDEPALRRRMNIEPDPAIAEGGRPGFEVHRLAGFEHPAISLIGLAVLDPGKHFEQWPTDHLLRRLVPELA